MSTSPLESEAAFNEYRCRRLAEDKTPLITSEFFVVPVPIYKSVEQPKGSGKFVRAYVGYSEVKVAVTVNWRDLAFDMATKANKNRKRTASVLRASVKAKIVS